MIPDKSIIDSIPTELISKPMSDDHSPLISLPEELLHLIFDHVDAQTLLLSVHQTCHRLRNVLSRYNRWRLDFRYLCKADFDRLCRLVDPEKVNSLVLADGKKKSGRIASFLSLVPMDRLSQLRSLSVTQISSQQLSILLTSIPLRLLRSCSIHLTDVEDNNPTLALLLAQASLHRFELFVDSKWFPSIRWPERCTIQRLCLGGHVSMSTLCEMLNQLMYLKTLVLDSICDESFQASRIQSGHQITSLTIKNLSIDVNHFEHLLTWMPSLTHLKIICPDKLIDGSRWKQWMHQYLPKLLQLEFFMQAWYETPGTLPMLLGLLKPFRTSFWLTEKQWYVAADYNLDQDKTIRLYTLPLCLSSLTYQSRSRKILLTTYDLPTDNPIRCMQNVHSLQLNIPGLISSNPESDVSYTEKSNGSIPSIVFRMSRRTFPCFAM